MKTYSADALIDSVGVNTHINYNDSVYDKFDQLVLPRLKELGVRHVRSLAIKSNAPWYYDRLKKMSDAGMKHLLGVGQKNRYQTDDDLTLLPGIVDRIGGTGAVSGFEGANEPDISGVQDWPSATPAYQKRLWDFIKGNAKLKHLPVVSPSITGNKGLVKDKFSAICDFLNVHAYPGGENQPSVAYTANATRKSQMAPGKPWMVTEVGYHNAIKQTTGQKGATEEAAGVYMPILILELFSRGVSRSYIYEFLDLWNDAGKTKQESNWGLLRNDGAPKPAFLALARLLQLLTGLGGAADMSDFDAAVTGDKVRSLFVRGKERSALFLWRDVPFGASKADVSVKLPKPIQEYRVHHFAEGNTVEVEPGEVASRLIWDAITTFGLDGEGGLEELGHKLVPGTLQVASPGASELVVPCHAGLVVLEF